MKAKIALVLLVFSPSLVASEATTKDVKISYGMSTCRNKRDYQEDKFAYVSYAHGALVGIYDGHCGDNVSSLLKDKFHTVFTQSLVGRDKKDAFEDAFSRIEAHTLQYYHDGSTALVVYIDRDQDKNSILHCAWVGDSRAVLECEGNVCFFTDDHKPHRKDEKERIEKVGGKISEGYVVNSGIGLVNGLAMSRSIGDSGMKAGKGEIIATPEYVQIPLKSDHHFLIMASDGLWDVITNEDAVAIAKEELDKNKLEDIDIDNVRIFDVILKDVLASKEMLFSTTESQGEQCLIDIAKKLQKEAIARNSEDNITVCVVKFDW